jgi:peptidoglycan/LPS O-acetylase OafA/YrhL
MEISTASQDRPHDPPASTSTVSKASNAKLMPALTGIRFFAVFHIFMFHLWTLYDMEKKESFKNLMIGFADLPAILNNFFAHGWLSTSFFFLLSGFILAYLYWSPEGNLTTSRKRFWLRRFARIYPIHILIMVITIVLLAGFKLSSGMGRVDLIGSALLTISLTHAWYPPAVPAWSWPTWTLSALVFLYFATPWLMRWLAKLSRRQMQLLLVALPLISLLPTIVYALIIPAGTKLDTSWSIFLGSTPLFWVPHFVAGMLLSRLTGISRFAPASSAAQSSKVAPRPWLAWGDLALLAVIGIACLPGLEEPLKYFLRHGLIMPLYMILILDLARGRGLAARLFSLPGTGILGETSFSIFIWQNMVMIMCWISLNINPELGHHHLWAASLGIVVLSLFSTYVLEKPFARWLRKRWIDHAKLGQG